jgi:hypothetical protein
MDCCEQHATSTIEQAAVFMRALESTFVAKFGQHQRSLKLASTCFALATYIHDTQFLRERESW